MGDGRSYATSNFWLAMDGMDCGIIQKFEGGDVEMEVTQLPVAHNYYTAKMGGNINYSGFKITTGISMSKPLQEWCDASLSMNYMRKNCAISALDFKLKERHVREFTDCLLTDINLPGCDGAAKDPAFVVMGIQPTLTRSKKGSDAQQSAKVDVAQKMWTPANYRVSIDGCDNAMKKVAKVNGQTFKQKFVLDTVGTERDYLIEPTACEFGDIELTISEEYIDDMVKWHEDFCINGNNTQDAHKGGTLEFLNQNRQTTLATLTWQSLGITKVAATPKTNNEDKISQYTVKAYCESWALAFG